MFIYSMHLPRHKENGFTIIELLIASVAFSLIIILVTVLIIQVSKVYYKGIIVSNTQNAARNIVLDIEKSIQFNTDLPNGLSYYKTGQADWYCIGNQLLAYKTDTQFNVSSQPGINNIGLAYSLAPICPSTVNGLNPYIALFAFSRGSGNYQQLLGNDMSVQYLNISQVGLQNLYHIQLSVAYGNTSLLASPINNQYFCKTQIGDQFCATSNINAYVSNIVGVN